MDLRSANLRFLAGASIAAVVGGGCGTDRIIGENPAQAGGASAQSGATGVGGSHVGGQAGTTTGGTSSNADLVTSTLKQCGISTVGSPTVFTEDLPGVLSGPNFGNKADVCAQTGWDLRKCAGQSVTFTSFDTGTTDPYGKVTVWVVTTDCGGVCCVYESNNTNGGVLEAPCQNRPVSTGSTCAAGPGSGGTGPTSTSGGTGGTSSGGTQMISDCSGAMKTCPNPATCAMTVDEYCNALNNSCQLDETQVCTIIWWGSTWERGCGYLRVKYWGDVNDHVTKIWDESSGKLVYYWFNGILSSGCQPDTHAGTEPTCDKWTSACGTGGTGGTGGAGGGTGTTAGGTDTGGVAGTNTGGSSTGGNSGTTTVDGGIECNYPACIADLFKDCRPAGNCTKELMRPGFYYDYYCYDNGFMGITKVDQWFASMNGYNCYVLNASGSTITDPGFNKVATYKYDDAAGTATVTCNGGGAPVVMPKTCLFGSTNDCTPGICPGRDGCGNALQKANYATCSAWQDEATCVAAGGAWTELHAGGYFCDCPIGDENCPCKKTDDCLDQCLYAGNSRDEAACIANPVGKCGKFISDCAVVLTREGNCATICD